MSDHTTAAEYPVDSSGVELAHVELDWGPVFAADLAGKLSEATS
jgi:hypothetical protein